MSYATQPAFIHYGTWDDEMRAHPALKWMEDYTTNIIDKRAWDTEVSKHHDKDFTFQKSTGQVVQGADAAWKALTQEVYAPFSGHQHDPEFLVAWEESDGWSMFGIAVLYWNLAVPGNEPKVKGKDGREWDGASPSAFKFRYVKDSSGGIKLKRTEIYGDPSAALVTMLKRGMLKGEDLVNM